ncbi:MAG: QueT transporter family protein [Erysipelotrichia bacterium]|nr:QueT transporter family protein [Erysipelotrichia bacterium]
MKLKTFAKVAMIAAVYTTVSLALAPISYGPIQIRIAEALTLLPLIYMPSIWGVTLGCFLTNLIGAMMSINPTGVLDVFVGTAATLLAAVCTYELRNLKVKGFPLLSVLMPVIFNFILVGIELGCLYFPNNILFGSLLSGAEVAAGELVSVAAGWFAVKALKKTNIFID